MCNAAVYFPNAHKEGVFLPGLFPGGGPRWSAEGGELNFWSPANWRPLQKSISGIYCQLGDYMVPTNPLREPGNSIEKSR